jgi:hypothetical protein
VRVEHRQGRLDAEAGDAGLQGRAESLGVRPRTDDGIDGQEGTLGAAADRELRQDQRPRRERGPGRGGAPGRGEGEATEPDRPGARRQPARLVDDRVAACSQALAGDVGKAGLSPRGGLMGDPEPRQREATIRLLPAEPAIRRQSRGEDGRAGIDSLGRDGDADQRPPSPLRRLLDSLVQTRGEGVGK